MYVSISNKRTNTLTLTNPERNSNPNPNPDAIFPVFSISSHDYNIVSITAVSEYREFQRGWDGKGIECDNRKSSYWESARADTGGPQSTRECSTNSWWQTARGEEFQSSESGTHYLAVFFSPLFNSSFFISFPYTHTHSYTCAYTTPSSAPSNCSILHPVGRLCDRPE